MASGYENRQGGRQSFAFQPAKASESPMAQAGGQSSGIQMQGGSTSIAGGIAAASQFTEAGPSAGAFGRFFGELLEPAIKRRKEEMFVKGMVDQMSAVAGEEIRASNSPINRIFGPNAYKEGAIFYGAKDAVNKWQANTMADIDRLKRLPPEELTKVVAASFDTMKTGDQFTDLAITTSLMEASQPVIGAIAKERYKWQQSEALSAWTDQVDSNADGFQSLMIKLAETAEPGEDNLFLNAARNNYMTSLMKPEGMDDETYRNGLIAFATRSAQRGNGYAVSALKNHPGFMNLLTLEEQTKFEDIELRYANRSLSRAAVDFTEDFLQLEYEMKFGLISAVDASAKIADINAAVRARTGFDLDLLDYKEVVKAGATVWSSLHSEMTRQQDYQRQLELRAQDKAEREAERAAEEDQEVAAITFAWATGDVDTAMVQGIGKTANYEGLAMSEYAQGEWTGMVRAYQKSQWVSKTVANRAQAQIQTSMGTGYTQDFEQGFQKFASLQQLNPALAKAYYGGLHAPLMRYRSLVAGKTSKQTAFQTAFSNPQQYVPTPAMTADNKKTVQSFVQDERGMGVLRGRLYGRTGLGKSGQQALITEMSRKLGTSLADGGDVSAHVRTAYEQVTASGAFEDYGRIGWSNPDGTRPLSKMLGLDQQEGDEVISQVVDRELKRNGVREGISADNYQIFRANGPDGKPIVYVSSWDDDEVKPRPTLIPYAAFETKAKQLISSRKSRATNARELNRRARTTTGAAYR